MGPQGPVRAAHDGPGRHVLVHCRAPPTGELPAVPVASPIRVLRVITRLNVGGPAIHTILLTQALNDGAQFESTLVTGITAPHEGDMLDLAAEKGVQPIMLPELGREISPSDDLVALAKMVRLIRQYRPDVVHTHMAKAGTVARLAARLCGTPLIVHTYHGHVFHSYFGPMKTRLFIAIERALGTVTHRVVVVGDRQLEEIAGYGVVPLGKLVAIPLGLELERFLDVEHYRGELRRELGVSSETPLVGINARLVPIKAHEDFFRAAGIVLAQRPDTRFVVIGDGERRTELEALVDQLGLRPAVSFLGWRQDIPRLYADLDVVALTSHNEGSPVALIEALAAARPVVGTAVGGVPEVVVDGSTGLLAPVGQPDAIAGRIITLLTNPAYAAQLGHAGRAHVYPRYASSRLVTDMRDLYLSELAARGRAIPAPPAATVAAFSAAAQ